MSQLVDGLYTAVTWWDAYRALDAVADEDFQLFFEQVVGDDRYLTNPAAGFLVSEAKNNESVRLAGFLTVSLSPTSDSDPVTELCQTACELIGDHARQRPTRRLLNDLLALVNHLPSGAWPNVLALAAASVRANGDTRQVELAVELTRHVPHRHPDRGTMDDQAGTIFMARYELSGDVTDLDTAIAYGERAIPQVRSDLAASLGALDNQATRLQMRYEHCGDPVDLARAIAYGNQILSRVASLPSGLSIALGNQANRLLLRYQRTGRSADLDTAIEYGSRILDQVANDSAELPHALDHHANKLVLRYQRTGCSADLDTAIDCGEEALRRTPHDAQQRAHRLGNQAARLAERFQRSRCAADLEAAIELGEHALRLNLSSFERPRLLDHHASRLLLRYQQSQLVADLDLAIGYGAGALAHTPQNSADRARRLDNQAARIQMRYQRSSRIEDLDAAIELGEQALTLIPISSPERPEKLSNQAWRFGLRYETTLAQAELDAVARLLREWCGHVVDRGGDFRGVFGRARSWCLMLSGFAANGLMDWSIVTRIGEVALRQAEHVSKEVALDDQVLWEVRTLLDGVVALAAYAEVQSGQPEHAVTLLESGSATVVRAQASRLSLAAARSSSPELTERVIALHARIDGAERQGASELVAQLAADYRAAVAELRRLAGVPDSHPATVAALAATNESHLWIIATPVGGAAIRHHNGGVIVFDLPELTADIAYHWQELLHPSTVPSIDSYRVGATGDNADDQRPVFRRDGVRGPTGQLPPSEPAILTVLDEMDRVFAPVREWLDDTDWIIPTGACRLLPWQARHPHRRLHLTATHTLTRLQPIDGPVVVFANPTGDLPGAQQEADTLRSAGHDVYPGADATLANLADIPLPARVLHIAAHGSEHPALWFHDGPLHPNNMDRFRHLWPHIGHLILNCCVSATNAANLHDETLSIATIALTHHTQRATVALWPLNDQHAATWATHHHQLTPPPNHLPTTTAYLTYG